MRFDFIIYVDYDGKTKSESVPRQRARKTSQKES
jgi:hypothetical protein